MAKIQYTSLGKEAGTSLDTPADTSRGDRYVAWIDAPEGSWLDTYVIVRDVHDPQGNTPGYCRFEIPVSTGHEKANAVVLAGPWRALLHGARVVVGRQRPGFATHWFWCGRVCTIDADINSDIIVGTAKDDRWALQAIRIVGRHVCEPTESSTNFQWQQGWPAIFNEGGRPNMMLSRVNDADGVLIPCFAPSGDYGIPDDEDVPDPKRPDYQDLLQTRAGYWTLSWILRYLSVFYGPGALSYYPSANYPIPALCPSGIIWPRGMGNQLDTESIDWYDEGRGQSRGSSLGGRRKGRELNVDGYCITDAIELICATAGGYTIGWEMRAEPDDSGQLSCTSVISLQPAFYKGGVGSVLSIVRGGTAAVNMPEGARYFNGGNLLEDSSDMVTSAIGLGSLAKIETRVDTITANIKARWSDDRLTAFKADADDNGVENDEDMLKLFSRYPEIGTYYQLDADWDFTSGTSESSYPRAVIKRPIMPHLLSFMGGVAVEYAAAHFPIRIEVSTDSGSTWVPTTELTRISVTDDGTIDLTALREIALAGKPGSWHWAGDQWDFSQFTIADLRLTIAIPCDHRVWAVAKLIDEELDYYDDEMQSPDAARIHSDFSRQNVLDLRGLYHLWLRKDSWPRPASAFSEPQASDRETRLNALRNDISYLQSHVRRHMTLNARLKGGGMISTPQVITTIPTGYQIQEFRHITADGTDTTEAVHRSVRARHFSQSESGGEQTVETELWLA